MSFNKDIEYLAHSTVWYNVYYIPEGERKEVVDQYNVTLGATYEVRSNKYGVVEYYGTDLLNSLSVAEQLNYGLTEKTYLMKQDGMADIIDIGTLQ